MSAERLLEECRLQLKYLNEKFGETGTTNALLSKLEANQSKEKQKQALIDMMKGDEELGLYKKPQQQSEVEELAKALDIYVKQKHTQEECIGFIDGFKANTLNQDKLIEAAELMIERLKGLKMDRHVNVELAEPIYKLKEALKWEI